MEGGRKRRKKERDGGWEVTEGLFGPFRRWCVRLLGSMARVFFALPPHSVSHRPESAERDVAAGYVRLPCPRTAGVASMHVAEKEWGVFPR